MAKTVTDLLLRAQRGDAEAMEDLLAVTYEDLRALAHARLRGGRDALLDTTSLVNEWFLRFVKAEGQALTDRAHYFRYAARVMRSVIVDVARRRNAERRGGGVRHQPLTIRMAEEVSSGEEEILRVHEALEALARLDERKAQVVEMRYFAGMNEDEIGEALGISERTVRRDWTKARLWLREALA